MDEVAVRAVDLQGAEPGQVRAPGGLRELVDDRGDGVGGEFVGRGDRSERDRTRAHPPQAGARRMGVGPGASDTRLAAGVVELDRRYRTGIAQCADHAGEGRRLPVVPQSEVVGAAAAFRADGGGLHHDQAGSAHRARDQVLEMPVGGCAGLRALGRCGVLHHRRHPDPVGDRHATQGQRLEELAHGISREDGTATRPVATPRRPCAAREATRKVSPHGVRDASWRPGGCWGHAASRAPAGVLGRTIGCGSIKTLS